MQIRSPSGGTYLSSSILAVGLSGAVPSAAIGQQQRTGWDGTDHHAGGGLVRVVREATRRFSEVDVAIAEGYQLLFGCVSGPDSGAMGLHYLNMALVGDGVLDARSPEIVIYEPLPNGGRRLIGADYLVFADAWHASNAGTPELMGQLLHLFEGPNRFGLPTLRLSSDGLSLYYASNRSGGFGKGDMYVATRASRQAPWNRAENLGPLLNTEAFEAFPTPSPDGLTLYFNRSTTFDSQDSDIWVSTRASADDQWSAPQRVVGEVNSDRAEFSPALSGDGATLYFASERGGHVEIWAAKRRDGALGRSAAEKLGPEVNEPQSMALAPFVSGDQRSLYFMSARPEVAASGACTPQACFDRLDLYVSTVRCP